MVALDAWVGYSRENIFTLTPALVLVGAGQGLAVAPLFGIALTGVPAHRAGAASGLLTTIVQAPLAVGAATLGLLFLLVLGTGRGSADFGPATVAAAGSSALLGLVAAILARRLPEIGVV